MSRLPSSQRYRRHRERWKRYEKPEPGHRVQVDVKFIAPLPGSRRKYYQFTAIDDCTRLRVLRIYDRLNQETAVQFLDYILAKLPFRVERIQTDNGAEFQSAFHYHVLDRGIGHVYIRPATRGSTARSSAPTGSTPRSSTGCSTAWSSTTPGSSTSACASGRPSTISTDLTAVWEGRHHTND